MKYHRLKSVVSAARVSCESLGGDGSAGSLSLPRTVLLAKYHPTEAGGVCAGDVVVRLKLKYHRLKSVVSAAKGE